jgi:polyphenol oxidase
MRFVPVIEGPSVAAGLHVWHATLENLNVRFTGRGGISGTAQIVAVLAPQLAVAWPRQVHSSTILHASAAGCCGEGDAVLTDRPGLAAAVVTADCVPVLLAVRGVLGAVAAVHAGWRGLVAGIVPAAVARLRAEPDSLIAWLGPAIGPCCYEVGEEVASRFESNGLPAAVLRPPARRTNGVRPHIDLWLAATLQLRAAGLQRIHTCRVCTSCDERLWSYRRDGPSAGRNVGFLWRDAGGGDPAIRA